PPSYGQEGYQLIILTLQSMFPEKTLEPYDLSPLGWNEIIFEFLLPEVAVLLIQDDL
ncbi:hypothetical protein L208DRAFT_1257856, partial [Tricholoma matsutake]